MTDRTEVVCALLEKIAADAMRINDAAAEAVAEARKGNANGAIGAMLLVERQVVSLAALYQSAIEIHRTRTP